MSYDKRQATREFGRWSENYDRSILQWLLFRPAHRAIIARVRAGSADRPLRILDVGCGTGVFAARIREALPHAKVWGVDLVSAMLAGGRARWLAHRGHVTPVQGDSERLPFPAGAFDVVTCANSFHHYPNQRRAIEEMHRVLKPGGRLILVDGRRDAPWGWFIYDVCVAAVEGDVSHASSRRVRELFATSGFIHTAQEIHRGLAPFLLTEGVSRPAVEARPRVPVEDRTGLPSHPSFELSMPLHAASVVDSLDPAVGTRVP